ncbi:hypothetical protein BDV59DRAFT_197406 [Aspergillus ambiguus]|uniref:uncharacterized protein n=1 Tax=Aspergillus ambiguus TaxID=176160 RepID=UPI003CCE0D87
MSSLMITLDRIPASVIYIALFATATGLFGHFWRVVHENPILFRPPYSPYLKAGTDGPFILSVINLAWLLLTIVPQECGWKCARAWWALVTVLRATNIVALSVFAFCQSQYLPRPLGSCSREDKWPEESGVPNGVPTIWDLLPTYIWSEGGRFGGSEDRKSPCEALVNLRQYEFALM